MNTATFEVDGPDLETLEMRARRDADAFLGDRPRALRLRAEPVTRTMSGEVTLWRAEVEVTWE